VTRELFYNAHPHADEGRLVYQWVTWQPRGGLSMNNPPFAMRLQDLRPEALVIARITDPFGTKKGDDAVADLGKPADWLARMCELVPDARVVLYAGNECHGSEGAPDWTLEAMERATAAGRRLCILNTGTGGPEDEEWWAGMPPTRPPDDPLPPERIGALAPVVRAWAVSEHLLGIHEYATMLDWRAARGWQVGRFERHLDTFTAMGITVPRAELRRRIAITEATFDSIPHSEHKGARWLPAEEAARQMIEMARQVYWDMPVLMYCLGHNSDPQWRMFRLDYAGGETVGLDDWGREFQAIVGAYMMEAETIDMVEMVVNVLQAVKRRSSPGKTGATGTMDAWQPGRYEVAVSIEETIKDGYCWRYFVDGDGGAWWSATGPDADPQQWIALAVVEPPAPEPEPEPEPEPTPEVMTPERWALLLRAWLDTLTAWETTTTALKGVLVETIEMIEASDNAA
jgi:hypothetical protein